MEKQTLPNSTLILIFGILSIISCWCYGIFGVIFGAIAIILSNNATKLHNNDPDMYLGYGNVKAGKIMAIIGVILSILLIIFLIGIISYIGWDAISNPELMQQRIQELQQNQ